MRHHSSPAARIALGLLWAALAAPITAQEPARTQEPAPTQPAPTQPAPTQPAKAQEPATAGSASGADAKDAPAEKGPPTLAYAKVTAEKVQPRCFASARSPVYEDTLAKGAVVAAERTTEGDFRRIVLPQGPTGYVHANFATAPENGVVATKGENVSFRYRPQSAEAPVEMLPSGVQLLYLAREGDWLKVRHPGGPTWLEAAALEVFTGEPAALEAQAKALAQARDREWRDAVAALAQQQEAAEAAAAARQRLAELAAEFRQEAAKPTDAQDQARLTALDGEIAALAAKLQDPQDTATAQLLQGEIKKQRLLLEARAVAAAAPPPPPPPPTIGTPVIQDPLARFDAVGWLRRADTASGLQQFRLEKGGRVLYYVTCKSGRYDLRLFDGIEVGISGATDRVDRQSAWLLDAQRIEVLGAAQ